MITDIIEDAKISAELNKKNLITEAFNSNNGNTIDQVIQRYQVRFLFLSNYLYDSINEGHVFSNHLKTLDILIDELLHFLLQYFPNNFNYNSEIPSKIKCIKINEYSLFLKSIDNINSENSLLQIALQPIKLLMNDPSILITYNSSKYFDKLISTIKETIGNSTIECDLNKILLTKLIAINFNSWQFVLLLIQNIQISLSDCESETDKINLLVLNQSFWQQSNSNTDLPFNPNVKNIAGQINEWIENEMKRLQLILNNKKENHVEISKPKFNFNTSVPVTTELFKILKKIDIVNCNSNKELSKIIAQNCKTKHTGNLSAESVYNNCYKSSHSTKEELRDIIIKMLNEVNKI